LFFFGRDNQLVAFILFSERGIFSVVADRIPWQTHPQRAHCVTDRRSESMFQQQRVGWFGSIGIPGGPKSDTAFNYANSVPDKLQNKQHMFMLYEHFNAC